jgi:hypothetical protein
MKYNNYGFARESSTYYDEGLRIYILSIYRNMSMALSLSYSLCKLQKDIVENTIKKQLKYRGKNG